MSYEPINWKDRIVEKPRTYHVQNNPDGTITLIPAPGTVVQEGTPVNAANLNKMEQGILDALDNVHYQEFLTSGTWTKPEGVSLVLVQCVGGGGGGGGGGAAKSSVGMSVSAEGGAGGAGGGALWHLFSASDLPSTIPVIVGAGGRGGSPHIGVEGSPTSGTAGGNSKFGDVLIAYGGGYGGTSARAGGGSLLNRVSTETLATGHEGAKAVTGYGDGNCAVNGGASGGTSASTSSQYHGKKGGSSIFGGAAGGAGGGIYKNSTVGNGGSGGIGGSSTAGGGASGGTGGVAKPGEHGADGNGIFCGGGGGGGGANTSSSSTANPDGGNGGFPGGGGGGGGAGVSSSPKSGRGGDGGNGVVRVWAW